MATAKLYLGNIPIGGDIESAEFDDLKLEVEANRDAIKEINDVDLPGLASDINDVAHDLNTLEGVVDGHTTALEILANASVTGKYELTDTTPPTTGQMFIDDLDDFANATTVHAANIDKVGSQFTWTDLKVGDIIQVGSQKGKGMFQITNIQLEPLYADFSVDVLVSSTGHTVGEPVGVTVGSPVDTDTLMQYIINNATDIQTNVGAIDNLTLDVEANTNAIGDKLDAGSATLDGGELQALAEKNADDIKDLSTGGNPAVDALEAEAVRNTNRMSDPTGDVGVLEIEVVTAMPPYPKDTTLYVVKA